MEPQTLGTAAWAQNELVAASYPFKQGRFWVGQTALPSGPVSLGYNDDRHICVVSGTRGGKGATILIPALATWPGSVCVIDPKGENATVTAARRGAGSAYCDGMGQKVCVLDPFGTATIDRSMRSRFNPLDTLDPESDATVDEADMIAGVLVPKEGEVKDPFWQNAPRQMLKSLILHVVSAPEFEGERNLVTVRKLLMRGDWRAVEALREAGVDEVANAQTLLWSAVRDNPAFDGILAENGTSILDLLERSEKTFESVIASVRAHTNFIESSAMRHILSASDFKLSELKTHPEGMSLYLCLPQRAMVTHAGWLRMIVSLLIGEMEKVKGLPANGHRILLLLDEFARLKYMEVLEDASAQIAGSGVKLCVVVQNIGQLKKIYKENWETFISSCGLKLFFSLDDETTQEYVSKYIGEMELSRETRTGNETRGDSTTLSEGTSDSTAATTSHSAGDSQSTSRSTSGGTNSSAGRSLSGGTNSSIGQSTSGGTNSSTGASVSGGTNSSASLSKSGGTNESTSSTISGGTSSSTSSSVSGGTSESTSRSSGGSASGASWGSSRTSGSSVGWSQSKTEGRSDGWSESATKGRSAGWSESESEGRSDGWSKSENEGRSEGWARSENEGRSDGWSTSENDGKSNGWSDGVTSGTTNTRGDSTSKTIGANKSASKGESRSQSAGLNEGLHRRRLIHPDEIGRMFARIDDPEDPRYPGLGIALISGQQPIVFRRVNYFEHIQFIRCFDPHPDHPFRAGELDAVKNELLERLGRMKELSGKSGKAYWLASSGQGVLQEQPLLEIGHAEPAFNRLAVVAPWSGRMDRKSGNGNLFSICFYRPRGLLRTDPFTRLDAAIRAYEEALEKKKLEAERKRLAAEAARLKAEAAQRKAEADQQTALQEARRLASCDEVEEDRIHLGKIFWGGSVLIFLLCLAGARVITHFFGGWSGFLTGTFLFLIVEGAVIGVVMAAHEEKRNEARTS